MKTAIIASLCLIGAVEIARANDREEIARCAAEQSDAARLICFDQLARSLGVDTPFTTVQESGAWKVRIEKSPIDDRSNVYLSVESEEIVWDRYESVRPTLHVRCSENETNVYLNWGIYLGLDKTDMLTRFDSERAKSDTYLISTDRKAVFVRGSDIDFAKKIMKHNKLLVQITPYGQNPIMATFKVSGLSEAIKPLRGACGW